MLVFILTLLPCCTEEDTGISDEDWSFVAFGDLRQGYGIYGRLVHWMSRIEPTPAFAVCLGDIMLDGSNEAEWENFWKVSEPITGIMPMYISRGNHDGNDDMSERIFREQTGIEADTFYYAFTYDHSTFIILDSYARDEENSIGMEQLNWLKTELESASSDTLTESVFLFLHHPLFPQGIHRGNGLKNAVELHNIFLQHPKIKAVVVAHDHLFNRFAKDGINYITTGGAGGPLHRGYGGDYYHFVKISYYRGTNHFEVKTIGIHNEIVDQFDL